MARQSLNSNPVTCERLEDRQLLSASWDVTYTYGGKIKIALGDAKVKEAITIAITSQSDTGFVSGQINSAHSGTVDVKGNLQGNQLTLVGATSGRLLEVKLKNKGLKAVGTLTNGIDKSVGKFKAKAIGDAPSSLPPASRAANDVSLGTSLGEVKTGNAIQSTAPVANGVLDPSIDPATGLPINPSTGTVIDPSVTVDDNIPTPPLPSGFPPAPAPTPSTGSLPVNSASGGSSTGVGTGANAPLAAGDLIGANYSILGIWDGQFNFDSSGQIEDILTGSTTSPPVAGTRPGTDPRAATFDTSSQDVTGLVSGTLTIAELGTYVYTGFVNGTHIDLVLSGAGSGLITADLNTTFDSFSGMVINAEANGFRANGPIFASYTSGGGTTVPLPAGEELFHVDTTNGVGDPTVGNFDPNGASLGMDFSVGTVPLIINSLGAFDDNADGLSNTIRVAIYNINTPANPIVAADITTVTSGLAPNSSFRYLTDFVPVTLTTGVYRIVAFGYGAAELAGDIGVTTYTGPVPSANTGSTGQEVVYPITNGLNANNYFSNAAGTQLVYPTRPDGLPLNRYLAGSFLFEEGTPPDPGGGGGPTIPPPPPLTKPANSAFPGGVIITPTGPEVLGSQSDAIIP